MWLDWRKSLLIYDYLGKQISKFHCANKKKKIKQKPFLFRRAKKKIGGGGGLADL